MRLTLIIIMALCLCACKSETTTTIESTMLLETTTSWNGDALPEFPEGRPKVSIVKVTIPPGAKLPKHIHPVITTGMITKGELTVTDADNNTVTIREGDVLVEVSNTIHFGENTGNGPAEIIVFYIGDEATPTTVLAEH